MYPHSFQLGPFSVNGYGVMVALAFVVGLWTAAQRSSHAGVSGEKILDLGPWLLIGAILGARVLYVITFWREQFAGEPFVEVFKVWTGGLVYYGGLIGASLTCIVYCLARKLPLWTIGDIMAPSVALGQAFGRIGCLLNGCCYGVATHLPWAISYPAPHATHPAAAPPAPVHPTQIYEAVACVALYAGLAWLFRRRKFDGQVFGVFLVGYAIIRSWVELFRGDYPSEQLLAGGATPAHQVSVLSSRGSHVVIRRRCRRRARVDSGHTNLCARFRTYIRAAAARRCRHSQARTPALHGA